MKLYRWAVRSHFRGVPCHETRHWTKWGARRVAKGIRRRGRYSSVEVRVVRL